MHYLGYDYPAADIGTFEHPGFVDHEYPENCMQLCLDNPECTAVVVHGGKCHFKGGLGYLVIPRSGYNTFVVRGVRAVTDHPILYSAVLVALALAACIYRRRRRVPPSTNVVGLPEGETKKEPRTAGALSGSSSVEEQLDAWKSHVYKSTSELTTELQCLELPGLRLCLGVGRRGPLGEGRSAKPTGKQGQELV